MCWNRSALRPALDRKREQRLPSLHGLEVERDALFPAVILLHRQIRRSDFAAVAHAQRTIRIAASGGLDLDDLGALIGQQHAGARHEHVLSELNDANTGKNTFGVRTSSHDFGLTSSTS